jgi:hypothetical protein
MKTGKVLVFLLLEWVLVLRFYYVLQKVIFFSFAHLVYFLVVFRIGDAADYNMEDYRTYVL